MAGNNSIQFLRGDSSKRKASSESLLPGQPFYETDTNKLYVGSGTKNLLNTSAINGSGYDTVITNQAEFKTWYDQLDRGTYTGESVLILSGTYMRSDGLGLHLPENLKKLDGLGNVQINISDFVPDNNTNKAGIWFDSKTSVKNENDKSIQNILLNIASTNSVGKDSCTGFLNCINLINCICGALSQAGTGFHSCDNLINCKAYVNGSGSNTSAISFVSCSNLINCEGSSQASNISYGIYSCSRLTNCTSVSQATGSSGSRAYGFNNCDHLNSCIGNASAQGGYHNAYGFFSCTGLTNCSGRGTAIADPGNYSSGYTFYNCKICSNCTQDSAISSESGTWGGESNKNISSDTCPEYVG